MPKIVQRGDPVLHDVAAAVPTEKIDTPEIAKIIADMKEALASCDDGVAIAAPQIGVSLRIFVISKRAFDIDLREREGLHHHKALPEGMQKELPDEDMVFINPEIVKLSKRTSIVPEGCLSVRWIYGKTRRADKATIRAYDEHGNQFTRGGSGLIAQIFQHETDHLNGILFIDHAKDLEQIDPNMLQEHHEHAEHHDEH